MTSLNGHKPLTPATPVLHTDQVSSPELLPSHTSDVLRSQQGTDELTSDPQEHIHCDTQYSHRAKH